MNDVILGQREFSDGAVRTVFQTVDGRQFVLDGDERAFGVWLDPQFVPDSPVVVSGR